MSLFLVAIEMIETDDDRCPLRVETQLALALAGSGSGDTDDKSETDEEQESAVDGVLGEISNDARIKVEELPRLPTSWTALGGYCIAASIGIGVSQSLVATHFLVCTHSLPRFLDCRG